MPTTEGIRRVLIVLLVGFMLLPLLPARAVPTLSAGSVAESAVDLDHDGRYDWLRFTVPLNVSLPGNFTIQWYLHSLTSSSGQIPAFQTGGYFLEYLAAGARTLTFQAYGPLIYLSHMDGPYNLTVHVQSCVYAGITPSCSYVTATHDTQAYRADDFDPPPVTFGAPITDFGRDLNGDGLYDELVVQVPLDVVRSAVVSLQGTTTTAAFHGNSQQAMDSGAQRELTPGTYLWNLTLPGLLLRLTGANMRYNVSVSASMDNITGVERTYHLTALYDWNQFTLPSASVASAATWEPADPNGNGAAQRLLLRVPLHIGWTGTYSLSAYLSSQTYTVPNVEAHAAARLDPGNTTVTLSFNGIAVNRLPVDGPWLVYLYVERADGVWYDNEQMQITTPAYTRTEFASAPVAYVNVTTNAQSAWIWAVDTHLGLVTIYSPSGYPYSYYPYPIPLYSGTFELLGWAPGSGLAPVAVRLDVARSVSLNFTFPAASQEAVNTTITFSGANASRETVTYSYAGRAPMARFYADLFGNSDGQANASEIAASDPFPEYVNGAWFGHLPSLSYYASPPMVIVDGQGLSASPLEIVSVDGAGDVASRAPLNVTVAANWTTGVAPLPGGLHAITLILAPSSDSVAASDDIALPPGVTGTLTASDGIARALGPGHWQVLPIPSPGAWQGPLTVRIQAFFPMGSPSTPPTSPGGSPSPNDYLVLVTAGGAAAAVAAVAVATFLLLRRRKPPIQGGETERT